MNYLKKLLPLALSVAIIAVGFAGCGNKEKDTPNPEETSSEASVEIVEESSSQEDEEAPVSSDAENNEEPEPADNQQETVEAGHSMTQRIKNLEEQLKELKENEYDGLEFTAAISERKAIIPGGSMNVHVTITNNGDQTVIFQQGSSDMEVPDALYVYADGLQTMTPEEDLGPRNMMMSYLQLAPGESVTYVYPLLAIEPNENFDEYSLEIYGDDTEEYIGNMGPDALQERFSDIVLAAPGNYEGHAVFTYHLEGAENPTGNPTGYATADFTVNVTE